MGRIGAMDNDPKLVQEINRTRYGTGFGEVITANKKEDVVPLNYILIGTGLILTFALGFLAGQKIQIKGRE